MPTPRPYHSGACIVLQRLTRFFGGLGFIAYIALALVMPGAAEASDDASPREPPDETTAVTTEGAPPSQSTQRNRNIVGIILIGIGVLFLLQQLNLFWWLSWGTLWPIVLIAIGIALVAGRMRN